MRRVISSFLINSRRFYFPHELTWWSCDSLFQVPVEVLPESEQHLHHLGPGTARQHHGSTEASYYRPINVLYYMVLHSHDVKKDLPLAPFLCCLNSLPPQQPEGGSAFLKQGKFCGSQRGEKWSMIQPLFKKKIGVKMPQPIAESPERGERIQQNNVLWQRRKG